MHDAFEQFKAFPQDGVDNKVFAKTKLAMPILGIGADHSFGTGQADNLRQVAGNVQSAVIANSGHWLMEEQPDPTVVVIVNFLEPHPERKSP